jgi:hypothetical protein
MAITLHLRVLVDSVVAVLADPEAQHLTRLVRVGTGGLDEYAVVLAT